MKIGEDILEEGYIGSWKLRKLTLTSKRLIVWKRRNVLSRTYAKELEIPLEQVSKAEMDKTYTFPRMKIKLKDGGSWECQFYVNWFYFIIASEWAAYGTGIREYAITEKWLKAINSKLTNKIAEL